MYTDVAQCPPYKLNMGEISITGEHDYSINVNVVIFS